MDICPSQILCDLAERRGSVVELLSLCRAHRLPWPCWTRIACRLKYRNTLIIPHGAIEKTGQANSDSHRKYCNYQCDVISTRWPDWNQHDQQQDGQHAPGDSVPLCQVVL